MRILVTGHTGLIGSHLLTKLQELGHEVVGMSRSNGFDLNNSDLTCREMSLVRPEVIFHLAANAAESRGQTSPIDMVSNNVGIFTNVLRAAINCHVGRIIYVSSVSVYGTAPTPYLENGPTLPRDVYGVTKLACEQILKIMAERYGFEYVIFRPHNVYGPGQKMNDPYRNVVALFMRNLKQGKPYKIYGGGKMLRGFSYVDDVVKTLTEGLRGELTNKTLNVGSTSAVTITDLSDMLRQVTDIIPEIEYLPARPQEITDFTADHTLQDNLVLYPDTSLQEGLKKTWEWVKGVELGQLVTLPPEISPKL